MLFKSNKQVSDRESDSEGVDDDRKRVFTVVRPVMRELKTIVVAKNSQISSAAGGRVLVLQSVVLFKETLRL